MNDDADRIERVVDRAVRRDGDDTRPVFYAVTGSHIYGFPTENDSDVDVRGFHLADWKRYALLDGPREQIIVNQDGITEGFEDYPEIDLVSYELKKFTRLLYQANFNVLEVVFAGEEVINSVPLEMAELHQLIEERLPLDVARTYYGMAKSNYWKQLNPNRESYTPSAKTFLYVLRGLLAARYVQEERKIEANVRVLSEYVLGDTDLVDDLIAVKVASETATVDDDLAARADEQITRLFTEVEPAETVDNSDYRNALNEWMLKVRT